MILRFETQLRYQDSNSFILFENLASAENDLKIIDDQLTSDLEKKWVIEIVSSSSYISSSLELMFKSDDD
jgi:hypothetical protein